MVRPARFEKFEGSQATEFADRLVKDPVVQSVSSEGFLATGQGGATSSGDKIEDEGKLDMRQPEQFSVLLQQSRTPLIPEWGLQPCALTARVGRDLSIVLLKRRRRRRVSTAAQMKGQFIHSAVVTEQVARGVRVGSCL